jgi:valyl-tRNA synthetase
MELFVDLADLIDLDAELARKRDEREKLEARIAAQEKKLANENFVARAPAAVVQKERETLAALQQQFEAAAAATAQLEGILAKRGERT